MAIFKDEDGKKRKLTDKEREEAYKRASEGVDPAITAKWEKRMKKKHGLMYGSQAKK